LSIKIGEKNLKEKNKQFIKIVKNGPFLVYGGIPLIKLIITTDTIGYPYEWVEKMKYPQQEEYALCRCGQSENKPFCDGKHEETGFQGIETAGRVSYLDNAKEINGTELILTDNQTLCNHAGFCARAGGIGNLVIESDDPEAKKTAIQIAGNCNSGRFVVWDKETKQPIEPDFELSIAVTEEPEKGVSGPLWVRGKIPLVSAEGITYEVRNRVTLCRCGQSFNKPYCDGTHIEIGFNDGDESI
jgi:CDGSH-type Zn-finger protein